MDILSGWTTEGWQKDTLNGSHEVKDQWEGQGRDGLMELERRSTGEEFDLRTWRKGGRMKTETPGETLSSVRLLTDENLPGGW